MNTYPFKNKERGFSMIEVLISVVVLGFGLLALAAIQTTIIRASSETKAQSVALQLAKDKIEDLRSFESLSGYKALNDETDCTDTTDDTTNCIIGGVDYTRTTLVTRYAWKTTAPIGFVELTTKTGDTPAGYTADNEYKRVLVSVTWADANGVTQTIGLEDGLGAISPDGSSKVTLNSSISSQLRKPRVLINNPGAADGVIPIAVDGNTNGIGSNTAATNPKPVISGNGNNTKLVETRFDVLTYAALSSSLAQAQSRVETIVVGCTCSNGNANTNDVAYRPTYWNGERYIGPSAAAYSPIAGASTAGGDQSSYCTACCRDHHDPGQVEGPKFDPRRTTHAHYKIENGLLVLAQNNDPYLEACRLIRVDGFFRVASDLSNDYFNLLEARNDGSTNEYIPTTTASTNYKNMVLDYMNARVVNQTNSASYNTLVSSTAIALLETARNINAPTSINLGSGSDFKWLHSRGLFIDYLEPEAIEKITSAKTSCVDQSNLAPCVLKYMPFTSINMSELSKFSPTSGQQLVVTNNEYKDSADIATPVRGKVSQGSNPTPYTTQVAYSNMYHSNSAVAAMADPIDPDEVGLQDTQNFYLTSGQTGGGYEVNFNGYPFSSSSAAYPTLSPTPSATCNPATQGGQRPNPFACTVRTIGTTANPVAVSLIVGNYNYSDTSQTSNATLSCTGPNTGDPVISYTPSNSDKYPVTYCKNYSVSSVNLSGALGSATPSDGAINETTSISFANIIDGDVINIGMTFQNETKTTNTCTYRATTGTCNGKNCTPPIVNTFTITTAACQ